MSPQVMEIIQAKRRFKQLPWQVRMHEAEMGWRRRLSLSRLNHYGRKPKVTVIRAQGKPLMVLRAGRYFVSSFTWPTLIEKAALGPWKRVAGTTLEKRLP